MGAGIGSAAALIIIALIIVLVIRGQRQVSKRSLIVNVDDRSRGDAPSRNSDSDLNTPYVYQPPIEMDAKRAEYEIAGSPIHEMVGSSIIVRAKSDHRKP